MECEPSPLRLYSLSAAEDFRRACPFSANAGELGAEVEAWELELLEAALEPATIVPCLPRPMVPFAGLAEDPFDLPGVAGDVGLFPLTAAELATFLDGAGALEDNRRLPVGDMGCLLVIDLNGRGGRDNALRISSIALGIGTLWTMLTACQSAMGTFSTSF